LGTGFKAPTAGLDPDANSRRKSAAAAAGLNFSCIFLGQFLGPFVLRLLTGPFGIHGAFIGIGATADAVRHRHLGDRCRQGEAKLMEAA